jgi:type I restriction enzyme M protein
MSLSSASEQPFLRDLDKKLWTAADRLRANLDAAVYKHAVLGLIFLKYVSDSFAARQKEIEAELRDPQNDYFLDAEDYGGANSPDYVEAIRQEFEDRDYYTQKNVFWVPALARWKTLQNSAKLPPGTEIEITNGQKSTYKISSTGRLIDDALDAIERENPKLKGVLNKTYTQLQLDPANLSSLIDLIATIPFEHADLHAKDILGHVYEYFLGQFALAEGKKGGQYFTPKSIVSLIVAMLEPYQGRVYDPAMGSGGFFVQSEKFIEEHGGKLGNLSVYGQESNPTTWRLAAMNMAIRGIDFNFGKEPANSFTSDQHPDLRADYVMANPPFNMSEWWDAKLEDDPRWRYGTPPKGKRKLRLDPTHAPPPCPAGQHGAPPGQWLYEQRLWRRRRHPPSSHRGRPRRVHGGTPWPALHEYPDSCLHLVPHKEQKGQGKPSRRAGIP